ncbi:MAG: class II fructose-bisphosphate aldolase [Planctomycetota bacterium]
MQIITERPDVLAALDAVGELRAPLLMPNAETPDEIEAVLSAAEGFAEQRELSRFVIGLGITASYPDHAQLRRLQRGDDAPLTETMATWLRWIGVFADRPGLYERVAVIPFLDHGWAPDSADLELMRSPAVQDGLGILMFDGSAWDWDRNVAETAAFVEAASERVVVEGCPDKILSEAEITERGLKVADMLTDPDRAARYVEATGVDLIVPNLGTEHRATADRATYHADRAQAIRDRVGPRLALHGTSSLGSNVGSLAGDGIVKVNFYTGMTRVASHKLRGSWRDMPSPHALPLPLACGSHVYTTRRGAACERVGVMLSALWPSPDSDDGR